MEKEGVKTTGAPSAAGADRAAATPTSDDAVDCRAPRRHARTTRSRCEASLTRLSM